MANVPEVEKPTIEETVCNSADLWLGTFGVVTPPKTTPRISLEGEFGLIG
jgi:hypothetical protein